MRMLWALLLATAAGYTYYSWQRDPYEHHAFSCAGTLKSEIGNKISEIGTIASLKVSLVNPKFYWSKSIRKYYGDGSVIVYFSNKIGEKTIFDEEILEIDKSQVMDILKASSPVKDKRDVSASLTFNVVGNDVSFNRYSKNAAVWPKIFILARCNENLKPLKPLRFGIF